MTSNINKLISKITEYIYEIGLQNSDIWGNKKIIRTFFRYTKTGALLKLFECNTYERR